MTYFMLSTGLYYCFHFVYFNSRQILCTSVFCSVLWILAGGAGGSVVQVSDLIKGMVTELSLQMVDDLDNWLGVVQLAIQPMFMGDVKERA